jgi:uncharacterized protein GlcG (DUF336 family)
MSNYTYNALKLTMEGAKKVLEAALAGAKETGKGVCVAVVDDGGNLMAFMRTDDAILMSINVAIAKARAAAFTRFLTGKKSPSGNERSDHHALAITLAAGTDSFVSVGGGAPIVVKGQVVGGVSVSGAAQKDEEIAIIAGKILDQ